MAGTDVNFSKYLGCNKRLVIARLASICCIQSVLVSCNQRTSADSCSFPSNRLFELSRHERAKSHQSASSSYDGGAQDHSKPAWDAAFFGPSGLLPGQTHTPTRIGRDLHELVAQSNQQTLPGQDAPT